MINEHQANESAERYFRAAQTSGDSAEAAVFSQTAALLMIAVQLWRLNNRLDDR
jgi:hypothetical protein